MKVHLISSWSMASLDQLDANGTVVRQIPFTGPRVQARNLMLPPERSPPSTNHPRSKRTPGTTAWRQEGLLYLPISERVNVKRRAGKQESRGRGDL